MKSKYIVISVMIAVWCTMGLMVDAYLRTRAAAQPRAESIKIQWEKIGVLPFFKGRQSAEDTGETLACPVCELYYKSENIKDGADRAITNYLQETLKQRYGNKVIAPDEVSKVYREISRDDKRENPRSFAQKVGRALGANFMIVGSVWRYMDRMRDPMGPGRGASVAFEIYLIDVPCGKTMWKVKFDKTQRPFTEDIRGAKVLLKKGAKWLPADELARYGVEEIAKKFPL
jgi:hypothetical protein